MFRAGTVFFENRRDAGQQLAEELVDYRGEDPVVLGIPRGGVPVAAPVAEALEAELDVIVVKKLGAPGNPELAIGAIGETGDPYLNEDVLEALSVDEEYLSEEARTQRQRVEDLASEFRDVQNKTPLDNRTAILVDDGIATGATTRACLEIAHGEDPETIVLAVPVAPAQTIQELRSDSPADEVVCLQEVQGTFGGIGGYYGDFSQVSSEHVRDMLHRLSKGDSS